MKCYHGSVSGGTYSGLQMLALVKRQSIGKQTTLRKPWLLEASHSDTSSKMRNSSASSHGIPFPNKHHKCQPTTKKEHTGCRCPNLLTECFTLAISNFFAASIRRRTPTDMSAWPVSGPNAERDRESGNIQRTSKRLASSRSESFGARRCA